MRLNKENGRFYADPSKGEAPRLVLSALAMFEAVVAQSEDDNARFSDVLFEEVQRFISDDDKTLEMMKFRGAATALKVTWQQRCEDGRDAYQIDMSTYGRDPIMLVKAADVILKLFIDKMSVLTLKSQDVEKQ